MGFLVLLERLTPVERAVLVLHDALGYPSRHRRSRRSVRGRLPPGAAPSAPPRHGAPPTIRGRGARAEDIAQQFMTASLSGDTAGLLASWPRTSWSRATAAVS